MHSVPTTTIICPQVPRPKRILRNKLITKQFLGEFRTLEISIRIYITLQIRCSSGIFSYHFLAAAWIFYNQKGGKGTKKEENAI